MIITKEWLKEKNAYEDCWRWSFKQKGFDNGIEIKEFLIMLVNDKKGYSANWVIVKAMTRPQYLSYAIYSAEKVIRIYEKKYPNKAPREAIESAKEVLTNNTAKNRRIAYVAAAVASRAAAEANAPISYAAEAAAYAAYAAGCTATNASAVFSCDDDYADNSADEYAVSAAESACDARNKIRINVLNYGIELLKKGQAK